jgi:hypothetical protein
MKSADDKQKLNGLIKGLVSQEDAERSKNN